MKLLYTRKQFQGEMEKALAPLKQENEGLREIINKKEYRFLQEKDLLEKHQNEFINQIRNLEQKVEKLTEDKKLLFGAKGGLTKYVHRLEKELSEAKEKLSQRYIVKELKPVKSKNTQVMKTKNGARTSKIMKKMAEDNEKE